MYLISLLAVKQYRDVHKKKQKHIKNVLPWKIHLSETLINTPKLIIHKYNFLFKPHLVEDRTVVSDDTNTTTKSEMPAKAEQWKWWSRGVGPGVTTTERGKRPLLNRYII